MVREILKKKIKYTFLTEYIKKSTLGRSGTSVLYIGCMVPKGSSNPQFFFLPDIRSCRWEQRCTRSQNVPIICTCLERWGNESSQFSPCCCSFVVSKAEFFLGLAYAPHHEGVRCGGSIYPLIHNLSVRGRWMVSFTPQSIYRQVSSHRNALNRKLLGSPRLFRRFVKQEIPLLFPGV